MALPELPLWSVGAVLILAGPWAVQRIADAWTKRLEKRTDDALATAIPQDEKAASAEGAPRPEETPPTDSGAGGSDKA